MKKLIILFLLFLFFPLNLYAHSGGTDARGGHYNRKTGQYHYHNKSKDIPTSPKTEGVRESSKVFWLNTNSRVRHNKSCRWFGKTKRGRFCKKEEGRACGICGG